MRTTYNLVRDALEPVYEWASEVDFDTPEPVRNEYANAPFERTTNIRLDYQPVHRSTNHEDAMTAFFSHLRDDLTDLVTNGDWNHLSDPLLKVLDGEIKRGERLSHMHIPRARLLRTYLPKTDTFEYILYLVLYVKFGSGQTDEDEVS